MKNKKTRHGNFAHVVDMAQLELVLKYLNNDFIFNRYIVPEFYGKLSEKEIEEKIKNGELSDQLFKASLLVLLSSIEENLEKINETL